MTFSKVQVGLVALVVLLLLLLIVATSCRDCDGPDGPAVIIAGSIDAGPGESIIEARLDGAVQAGRARIEQIEEKFEADIAAFDAHQRDEYERLRGGDDLEAAAEFLSQWSRSRRSVP